MQILNLISEKYLNNSISFNSNFLESNVLNIVLLLSGLIYVLKQFLGSILSLRQEKVLFAINESEERLKQANVRLGEAEKQLVQTQIIINQIIKEAQITAEKVRQSILEQGKFDIERLTVSSKASIKYAENQVKQQIQQQIISLAIKKVTKKLKTQMTSAMQVKIIDNNIMQLKGDIII
uniref:ATP synthase subunit b, chloroplastic n=1 Tax=Membranoptera weeksiae TaxID=158720 RepID=A0A1L1WD55_9FLOR|nr:ATP synthase CF0 B subunit [Membranoptera weeksiae]AHZ94732.1 ATP synthase CF0 B subunit [Membranoptera weeksiae]